MIWYLHIHFVCASEYSFFAINYLSFLQYSLNNSIVTERWFFCTTFCLHPQSRWVLVSGIYIFRINEKLQGTQQAKAHNKNISIISKENDGDILLSWWFSYIHPLSKIEIFFISRNRFAVLIILSANSICKMSLSKTQFFLFFESGN